MFENMSEEEAREQILESVGEYCDRFHNSRKSFEPGDRITYASRVYDREEMINLVDSSLEFWLTAGRFTEQFEKSFAGFLGVRFCSLTNSGSSANLLAFMALTSPLLEGAGDLPGGETGGRDDYTQNGNRPAKRRILPGDEVITVAAGFPTTVSPIIQYGAVPVFVDVTIPEYNIDVTKLEDALSDKTRAVMAAHTLGNPFDLEAVRDFCNKHGLWLIEDNCDALGSRYELPDGWHLTGTAGDIGTSSFYPPHHMTMGEGGAVYTNDPLLNRIIRSMRDWGRDCVCPPGRDDLCGHRFDGQHGKLPFGYDHKYVYSHFGYNLKATDMQAAIGCAQLKKFPDFARRRRKNFKHLYDGLETKASAKGFSIEDRVIMPKACRNSDPCWFGFMMTCRKGLDRKEVVARIENAGIQTRALFAGNLTKHPCFDEMRQTGKGFRIAGNLHNTDTIMERSFWVGVYPGMTEEMLDYMCEIIVEALE